MEHSNFSALVWLTEFSPQTQHGKPIETGTGKSLSEVLIYSSINPQYDNRLFNHFQVQYKKITRVEHIKNMFFTQIV